MPKKANHPPPFLSKTYIEIDTIIQPNNQIDFTTTVLSNTTGFSLVYARCILELVARHENEMKYLFKKFSADSDEDNVIEPTSIPKHLLN